MDDFENCNGEKIYSYYCSRDGAMLPYKKHRVLPLPEHQGQTHSCAVHAAVNCLESRIRIQQGEQHWNETPRLSIQHCVDACLDPATASTEGVNYKTVLRFLKEEGVTTANVYPFQGGVQENHFNEGPVFRLKAYEKFNYRIDRETEMMLLVRSLEEDGPFVGSFTLRESHDGSYLLTLEGLPILDKDHNPFKHGVLIVGHKIEWDENKDMATGHWVFMEAKGPEWRGYGFNRLAPDVLENVWLPKVDLDDCEFYQLRRGLVKKIIKAGDGPRPVRGQTVHIHWIGFGKYNDLSQSFYSTREEEGWGAVHYKVGEEWKPIEAWEEIVSGMQVGEIARVKCSPEFAFGDHGAPQWDVEPNSTIEIEIKLMGIETG